MMAWKLLFDSVRGTSHVAEDIPCQDYCCATTRDFHGSEVLIVACSDGAGSAKLAHVGSATACTSIVEYLVQKLACGDISAGWDHSFGIKCIEFVRAELNRVAGEQNEKLREFAATLLVAVIGQTTAGFMQIGDGAIVVRKEFGLEPVFWPQSGEYASTTNFFTDDNFAKFLEVKTYGQIDDIAIFTDGLERLVLNFSDRCVHQPALAPFFEALRSTSPLESLRVPLRDFLDSPRVNERTDDDKTLFVAVRETSHADQITL